MGLLEPNTRELANRIAVATFTAVNQTTLGVEFIGPFLMMATGGVGTVELQFSVDGGTNWNTAQLANGSPNSWAVPVNQVVTNIPGEDGILYRLRCSAFTSGPIAARLSGGRAA
jgi:hypothetical protein